MKRKAVIIAAIIIGLFLFFGQLVNAWHMADFFAEVNQPDWGPGPIGWAAAQLALYFALGYIIYRLMVLHHLLIRPATLWLVLSALMWEFFKYTLFHQSFPFLSFFILILFGIMFLLLNLFLFREDGRLGVIALPLTLFFWLLVIPWYYQLLQLNTIATQQ